MEPAGRRSPVRSGRGPDLVDYLEHRLLRRLGEPAGDACLHTWHQNRVSEGLPALLRVVQGDDGPPVRRRAGRMERTTDGSGCGVRRESERVPASLFRGPSPKMKVTGQATASGGAGIAC